MYNRHKNERGNEDMGRNLGKGTSAQKRKEGVSMGIQKLFETYQSITPETNPRMYHTYEALGIIEEQDLENIQEKMNHKKSEEAPKVYQKR